MTCTVASSHLTRLPLCQIHSVFGMFIGHRSTIVRLSLNAVQYNKNSFVHSGTKESSAVPPGLRWTSANVTLGAVTGFPVDRLLQFTDEVLPLRVTGEFGLCAPAGTLKGFHLALPSR